MKLYRKTFKENRVKIPVCFCVCESVAMFEIIRHDAVVCRRRDEFWIVLLRAFIEAYICLYVNVIAFETDVRICVFCLSVKLLCAFEYPIYCNKAISSL